LYYKFHVGFENVTFDCAAILTSSFSCHVLSSNYFQFVQLPYRLPVSEFQKANAAEVTENQKLPPGWVCITITCCKVCHRIWVEKFFAYAFSYLNLLITLGPF